MTMWWGCCTDTETGLTIRADSAGTWPVGDGGNNTFSTNGFQYWYRNIQGTGTRISMWYRWDNVTVAQGTTILSAHVTVNEVTDLFGSNPGVPSEEFGQPSYAPSADRYYARCTIRAHDVDDAPLVDASNSPTTDFDAAARTTAEVDYTQYVDSSGTWNVFGTPQHADGTSFNTIDFTSVIQEIVNRAGWTSGNAIRLFFDENLGDAFDNGSNQHYDVLGYLFTAPEGPSLTQYPSLVITT